MQKILLVEDEESIRTFLKINLNRNGFEVIETSNGEEAIKKALEEKPDLAILDIMLPGINGLEVCKIIREYYPSIGIIMLTARTQDNDKIKGLEFGADDYIIKPFNPLEIVLRIKAILRRIGVNEKVDNNEKFKRGPFFMDIYSQKLFKNNEEIEVTPKEFMLMKLFLENPNKAFTRDELLNLVWGYNYFGDYKIIDVNIRRLRTKIEDDASSPKFIETVWGKGYRWKG